MCVHIFVDYNVAPQSNLAFDLLTRRDLVGGSAKLVCTSECPSQSFAQEVAKGRSCHFRADFGSRCV